MMWNGLLFTKASAWFALWFLMDDFPERVLFNLDINSKIKREWNPSADDYVNIGSN